MSRGIVMITGHRHVRAMALTLFTSLPCLECKILTAGCQAAPRESFELEDQIETGISRTASASSASTHVE